MPGKKGITMFEATNMEAVETPEVETTETEQGDSAFMQGFLGTETEEQEVSEPDQEEAEATEESEVPVQPEEVVEETIPYTYNHATTQLPLNAVKNIADALKMNEQSVVELLEKGSNYDVLAQRQKPYFPLIKKINDYAKENGMDYASAIQKTMDAFDVVASEKYARELRQQYPTASPEMLNELARSRAAQARQQKLKEDARSQAEAMENERRDKWVSFFRNHADISSDSLSDRMLQALANNEDPELVFAQEQNSFLSKQNNELLQKQSNASRSPGSAKKTSGSKQPSDFMSGFWGK